ncbi:MAG: hypothetical protein Q8M16_19910 [Pirellulaceae bacterium]|nr:hypothetical protein [Pirellulaceae bacterium]
MMMSLDLLIQIVILSTTCVLPVQFRHASESLAIAIDKIESRNKNEGEKQTNFPTISNIAESLVPIKRELKVLHFPDNVGWLNAESRPMPDIGSHGIEQFVQTERKVVQDYLAQLNEHQKQQVKKETERLKLLENGLCRYLRLGSLERPFADVDSSEIENTRQTVENKLISLSDNVSTKRTTLIKRLIASLRTDVQEKLSQRLGFRASAITDLLLVYSVKSVFVREQNLRRAFDIEEFDEIVDDFVNRMDRRIDARFHERYLWGWLFYLLMTQDYSELNRSPDVAACVEKLDRRFQTYMSYDSTRPKHVNTDYLVYWASRYADWKSGRFKWTLKDRDKALFPYDNHDVTNTAYHVDVIESYHERHPPTTKKRATWTTAEFFSDEQERLIGSIEDRYKDLPILRFIDGPDATERLNQRNAELKEVLLPNQAVAYFQEFILAVGIGNYLLAPAVARELGLSDADREQILKLLEDGTKAIEDWEAQQRQAILRQALTTDLAKLLPQLEQRLGLTLEDIIKFDPGATYNPDSFTEPKGFYRAYSYFYNDKGDYYPDLTYQHHRKHLEQKQ